MGPPEIWSGSGWTIPAALCSPKPPTGRRGPTSTRSGPSWPAASPQITPDSPGAVKEVAHGLVSLQAGQAYDGRKRDLAAAEREAAAEVPRLDAKKSEVQRAAARTRELLSQMRARSASPSPSPSAAPSPPPSSGGGSGAGAVAVRWAMSQVGRPYCFGGAGPGCYDCSGLTMMAWRQAGVSLPHSSASQFNVGRRISASELQPGDLIFYYSPISHVSVYIGGGQRISATHTGDYVRVQSLGSSIVGYARPNG